MASVLRITGRGRGRRFVNAHRVLNRAAWRPRAGSRILLRLLVDAFVPRGPLVLALDDTIKRRWGRRITLSRTLIVLGSFVDGARDALFTRIRNPGFAIVNLAASYDVSETVSVFGRIDNLFDQRYENPNGFLGPGLAVYGGVRLTSF